MELLNKTDFSLHEALYCLKLKNMAGYLEACHFCNDKRCSGCPVPFDKNLTLNDLLIKIGVTNNNSFFTEGYKRGKNDVIFEIVWNNKIEKSFFDSF